MPMPIPLPAPGDSSWYDWATAVDDAVNGLLLNVRRLVYSGSAYPARPSVSEVAAGSVEYLGPTEPTDWLNGDTWIQAA